MKPANESLNRTLTVSVLLLMVSIPIKAAEKMDVKIIDRQNSETRYTYVLPGYSHSNSRGNANCYGNPNSVNCSGSTSATASNMPAVVGSYDVQGATLSLQLPDGRVAVVNCKSKYAPKGDFVNKRSCRVPLVNNIQAEFKGDNAKLKWPVSLDGKKMQSETYKILAVLDKP